MKSFLAKFLKKTIRRMNSKIENTFENKDISFNGESVGLCECNNKIKELINNILKNDLPNEVKGIAFIMHYNSKDDCELEILGTYNKKYRPQDDDWASDEDDFTPLCDTFKWTYPMNKKQFIQNIGLIIQDYLLRGEYASRLKELEAVGLSFDDGDMNILYLNENNQ